MKRCKNCLTSMKNNEEVCSGCGQTVEPPRDRARLLSVVVDAVIKELNLTGTMAPDEHARLVSVEILMAVKQSPAYSEWLKQLARLPLGGAVSSAVLLGWSLREAVESNWWDSLPRASDPAYKEALQQISRDIYGTK